MKIAVTIILMFLLSYFLGMWLTPDESRRIPEFTYTSSCDLTSSACSVKVNNNAVTISLTGEPSPLNPFYVNVSVEGKQPLSIGIEFEMDGMDMGFNKYQLKLVDDMWKVKSILPVCTLGGKEWNLIVTLNLKKSKKILYFKFKQ